MPKNIYIRHFVIFISICSTEFVFLSRKIILFHDEMPQDRKFTLKNAKVTKKYEKWNSIFWHFLLWHLEKSHCVTNPKN